MPQLDEWITPSGSPWMYLILYVSATIDGFFPPVPSESVVIVLTALASPGKSSTYWMLGAVAAVGAFTGDQIAYSIGRRLPVRDVRVLRSERARRAVIWAESALAHRGAAFIVGARFIPVGRVAVNMTAGSVGFSRVRFSGLAAVAALTWSAYSVAIGVGAAHLLDHPLLAVAAGVAGGVFTGALVDYVLKRLRVNVTCAATEEPPHRTRR